MTSLGSMAGSVVAALLRRSKMCRCFSTQVLSHHNIKIGDRLPNINVYEKTPDNAVNIHELFKGKKGILFAVPGAFLPGCSLGHIPEYVSHFNKFQKEGYSVLACVSVNDPYVMDAWRRQYGSDEIRMLADTNCKFTKAMDMAIDFSSFLGNYRSQRYSLLIDDSIVTSVSYEPEDTGLACLLCIERTKKTEHTKNFHSSKDDIGYKYL